MVGRWLCSPTENFNVGTSKVTCIYLFVHDLSGSLVHNLSGSLVHDVSGSLVHQFAYVVLFAKWPRTCRSDFHRNKGCGVCVCMCVCVCVQLLIGIFPVIQCFV